MFVAAATPPRLVTLILLSALSVVSLNMFLPSLSHIAAALRADYVLVNLSIAGYAAMTALLQLVMAPLSDRYGRRPVILAALAVFVAASLGCLLADDIWTFLACRLLQGAIVSGYAVSLAVIRDTVPARAAASRMGYLAMAWGLAPMLAPLVGGLLDTLFGWRASFWAFALLGGAVFALCWVDLGETNNAPSRTFYTQLRSYPALLRARRFWGYAACMAFSTGAFYAFLGAAPLVASTVFGISTASLGVYMGSTTAGFVVGSFLSGRFAAAYSLAAMMLAGRLVACAGLLLGLVLLQAGIVQPLTLFGCCALMGLGNGITMPSANAGALSVRPGLAGSASGLAGALTVAGGAVMSAATGAVLTAANAAFAMLAMMLLSSLLGAAGAVYVLLLDRREGRGKQRREAG